MSLKNATVWNVHKPSQIDIHAVIPFAARCTRYYQENKLFMIGGLSCGWEGPVTVGDIDQQNEVHKRCPACDSLNLTLNYSGTFSRPKWLQIL